MGEDLESLNLKELQQLEQQLESSLKHIRARKNQLMHESISELQKKERSLQEENKILQKELIEKQKTHTQQAQWEQTQPQTSSSSSSFMMGEATPATNCSNPPAAASDRAEDATGQPSARTVLPPWMVSHINNGWRGLPLHLNVLFSTCSELHRPVFLWLLASWPLEESRKGKFGER